MIFNLIISYPRTETSKFSQGTDLKSLIKIQTGSASWGPYATRLMDSTYFMFPRAGKGDDHAHPPIHPTKLLDKGDCTRLSNSINRKSIRRY